MPSDSGGQCGIAQRLTGWNLPQRCPDLALKRSPRRLHRNSIDGAEISLEIVFYGSAYRVRSTRGCQLILSVMQPQQSAHPLFVIGEVQRPKNLSPPNQDDGSDGRQQLINEQVHEIAPSTNAWSRMRAKAATL